MSKDSNIYGRLGSVGLNDILQLVGLTARTATVSITCRGRQGKVFFENGSVMHARAGDVSGEEALLRLVNWTDGEFVIEDGIDEPITPTIAKSVDAVILSVLTQLDESKRSGERLFTPFPPLDKPDVADVPALERRVRASRIPPRARPQPQPPPRRSVGTLMPFALVATLLLGAAAAFVAHQSVAVDATGLPDVTSESLSRAEGEAPESGVASEVLSAASSGVALDVDTLELLESHGVSLDEAGSSSPSRAPVERPEPAQTAAPAPAPRAGSLLVVVEPWAEIVIDGKVFGETPLPAFELSAGVHELVLSNPSFLGEIHDTVTIEGGRTQSLRYSFRDTGSLRVLVTPWADVFIDDRHVGQTPMDELEVTAGRHTLLLRHPSLGERSQRVEIPRGQSVVVEVDMR